MAKMLFPPDLNKGSSGAAVDVLHIILYMLSIGDDLGIVRDGDYGGKTVAAVKRLQTDLGLTGDDIDGNFGPKTRQALLEKRDINVHVIPGSPQYIDATDWLGPDMSDGKTENWQPDWS